MTVFRWALLRFTPTYMLKIKKIAMTNLKKGETLNMGKTAKELFESGE